MMMRPSPASAGLVGLLLALLIVRAAPAAAPLTLADVVEPVQSKMVKIHGAGGIRGLQAYQSGFLISDQGHVLTAWSYVLDTDYVTVTLADGRKFQGELIGADPRVEIAILKIPVQDVPHFSLYDARELEIGDRVLAFSNLFGVATGDEPASVQHGRVSAKTQLVARRGIFETPYDGPIYVLDAMTNNPGAAGGVLTNLRGEMAGVLGKQLRNAMNNTWLNYALPIEEIILPVEDILAGKTRPRAADEMARRPSQPWTTARLGLRLVPDVLPKTPPFIDGFADGSPAAKAGLQPDDLILFINQRTASSCKVLVDELSLIDRIDPVILTVQRGTQLLEVVLE
jgi:S1-C subfamily serine protease